MKIQGKLTSSIFPVVVAVVCFVAFSANFANADEPKSKQEPSSDPAGSNDESRDSHASGQVVQDFSRYVQERSARRPSMAASSSRYARYDKRLSRPVLQAFEDTMKSNGRTAVRVMADGDQVALGMIVDSDGWIVTKASQLPRDAEISCITYDYRDFEAEIVKRVSEVDLALLRIPASGLPEAGWADELPSRGSFVATADLKMIPSSVGVVSAGIQSIVRARPVLGVKILDGSDGAEVIHVMERTGASEAKLLSGDRIFEVDGVPVRTLSGFKEAIRYANGGDYVRLKVRRGSRTLEVDARLMDLTNELLDDTELEVNGAVSARATNFSRVFSHDSILSPNQCGGPIVNLDGEVVGINIARAGRVNSLALPFDVVRPIVENLLEEVKLVSRNAGQASELQPVR